LSRAVVQPREAGEWIDGGLDLLRQTAEQYFTHDSVLLTHYKKAKHGATMLRLDEHTNDELDFQMLAPQRDVDAIAEGKWYDVGLFRASEEMVARTLGNVRAATNSSQQLSTIAWALYSAELFYVEPEAL
jgi:hypothetical protein